MFKVLIHSSSGACDLFVELCHGLYCSVRIEVFALAYILSGECLVVTCVIVLERVFLQTLAAAVSYSYWVFFVCSMSFDDVSWIYSDVMYMNLHITGTMRVGVTLLFGWGGVVSGCRLMQYCSAHVKWMYVLTPETCWALNNEIKKQVTSSWSIFIHLRDKYILDISPKAGCATFYWPGVISELSSHIFILQIVSRVRLSHSHFKEQNFVYPPCSTIGIAMTFRSVIVFH